MVKGDIMFEVGIDIVKIERIKKAMENESFLYRILGEEEHRQLKSRNFPVQSIAGNFCAKEAFSKAVGTGFRGIKFREIQIIRNDINKPYVLLSGNAFQLYGGTNKSFSVSISHTDELATAIVLYENKDNYI